MEEKNELHDLKCEEKQNSVDPKDNPKSNDFINHSFFHTISRSDSQSTITDGKPRIQERQTNVIVSRLVIATVILLVIGMFSAPIILYYTLKTDPIPELNSVLGEVNISESMVKLELYNTLWLYVYTYVSL